MSFEELREEYLRGRELIGDAYVNNSTTQNQSREIGEITNQSREIGEITNQSREITNQSREITNQSREITNQSRENEELKAQIDALKSEMYAQRLIIDGNEMIEDQNRTNRSHPYIEDQNRTNRSHPYIEDQNRTNRSHPYIEDQNRTNRIHPYRRHRIIYEGPQNRYYSTIKRRINNMEALFDRETRELLRYYNISNADICPYGIDCHNKSSSCQKLHRISIYKSLKMCYHGKLCKSQFCQFKHIY